MTPTTCHADISGLPSTAVVSSDVSSLSRVTYLPRTPNRHDDLASTFAVASNVAWKFLYVLDQNSPTFALCCGTTYTLPNPNGLTGDLAHERTENQLVFWVEGIQDINATPVDRRGGCRKGVVQMPEQRGGIGRVRHPVALVLDKCGQ